jgi:hypothetical protein
MGNNLNWKKGVFKSKYEILSGEMPVGNLSPDSWNNNGKGELNGKTYLFETKGFFNQETRIFSADSDVPAGRIFYNTWKTKATIEYGNKTFNWKYNNAWNTKWSLFDSDGILIRYNGSFTNGEIEIKVQDELLILAGMYISDYFWHISSMVIM